jgi:transcriptional regulator with XRE-family HTH domain
MPSPLTPAALRTRRAALGLSQAALAARLGASVTTLARWERGEHAIAHPEMVDLALTALEKEAGQ